MRSKHFGGRAVPAFPTDRWWSLTKKYNSRVVFRPDGPFKQFKFPGLGGPKTQPSYSLKQYVKPPHYGQKRGRSIFKIGK